MRMVAPVLCTSGLAAEARVARAAGFEVIIGAGDPERTAALVEAAIGRARCLVSFGIAGALAPHLRSGQVVLSADVLDDGRRWRADEPFQSEIAALARRIGAVEGPILGASAILATEADKRRAWRDTGALAVDLESAIVARLAAAAGLPFIVMRAIADTAVRALPPAALIPLAEDGTPVIGRVVREVLRRPGQVAALYGLARETRRALAALAGPAQALRAALAG